MLNQLGYFKDRQVVQASRHGLKLRYTVGRSTQTVHFHLCKGNLEPRTCHFTVYEMILIIYKGS